MKRVVGGASVLVALASAVAGWAAGVGRTVPVSVGAGGRQANGPSLAASVSGNGRFVVFASDASNLVRGDRNGVRDIFLRDLVARTVQRVSVSSRGAEANGPSASSSLDLVAGPSISADGRLVAFGSDATNLVAEDTNGEEDCFVRDLETHRTQRVSVSSSGAQGSGQGLQPVISANGRFVAFVSSSRLVPGASGATQEMFIRDLKTHRTRLVSVSSTGAVGNSASFRPSISADGRWVAFESFASNLVAGDTNNATDVFLHDSSTGRTHRLSVNTGGAQGNGPSFAGVQPSISLNGRYVVFHTDATNLVAGDTNASFDVMIRDLKTRTTRRVSVSSSGAQGNDASFLPSISANGRSVAFESTASNLATGDSPGTDDVFIRDLDLGPTQRLGHTSGGNLNLNSQQYEHADISDDGRYVAFASMAAHLVARDTNGLEDVFVRGPLHLALGLEAASQSPGQVPPPPCSAAVAGQPTFSASDLDELQSSRLIATHTIQVTTDFGATLVDAGSVRFSLPSSATVIRPHGDVNAGPGGLVFWSEKSGPVPVTATWTQDDGSGGKCASSASTMLQLQSATPIGRMKNLRAAEHLHPNFRFDLLWRFGAAVGRTADLDPVQVMARGVSQPRLPGAKLQFKTVTVPLRLGDPGFSDAKTYRISLPRWTIETGGDHRGFYLDGDARGLTPRNATLGYEVKVLQSGRPLARLRLAGRCNSFACDMRTVKVQLF